MENLAELLTFTWENFIQMFFLFVPFFVLNFFLSLTEGAKPREKKVAAKRITLTILVIGTILYFFGSQILAIFGLEIDGFRIGAGMLLLCTGINLALKNDIASTPRATSLSEIIVVPMAIPTILGPSCVSAIMIRSAEEFQSPEFSLVHMLFGFAGMACSMFAVGGLLYSADFLERVCGKKMIRVFSKLSGLILTSMASQMIIAGIINYLDKSQVGLAILKAIQEK